MYAILSESIYIMLYGLSLYAILTVIPHEHLNVKDIFIILIITILINIIIKRSYNQHVLESYTNEQLYTNNNNLNQNNLNNNNLNNNDLNQNNLNNNNLNNNDLNQNNNNNVNQNNDVGPKQNITIPNNNESTNNLIWSSTYDNDMKYNELPESMMKPLGQIDTSYTFMPPWKWWPPQALPPVCVSEKQCDPCPITTIGTPVDVKDWDASRHVTPGLGINIEYIKKLNNIYA
jgi:hypothetical protein